MASRSNPGPFPPPPPAHASPYGAALPAPAAKRNTTPLLIAGGVALLLLLVIGGVLMRMLSKPRGRAPAGNVPANFFQTAAADFAQAKQLLVDGKLTDSAEKFAESQHFRSRAARKRHWHEAE